MAAELKMATAGRTHSVIVAFALLLAGCAVTPDHSVLLTQAPKQAELQTPAQREHLRILASYGGVYDNPALHAMVSKTVARLVAASERPDLNTK